MSTTIDERVVAMKFDNSQFESNVKTSVNTLNNLKKGLDLSSSAKGLTSISDATNKISFDGITGGVDAIKLRFSALEVVAITALAGITNSAIVAGKRIMSALSVDPIMSGLSQYELKMNTITTILTNTAKEGTKLSDVNAALADLGDYAKMTIYDFSDMARNIGTFTAAGVSLKTSTEAIKGIGNLAAGMGSTPEQAATAMYQLSQAMSSGTVKLMDWNSVVNAGMGGPYFQDALKKTAKGMGIVVDNTKSFRDTLQDGWLTTKVLTATLAGFSTDKGLLQAATQVKTLTQLWTTSTEAVQQGWSTSWESIIGGKDEAAKLFTGLSDGFGSIVGASMNARNEMLKFWHDNGGRDAIIQALSNAFKGLQSILGPISEAFKEIFPPMTGAQLVAISKGLRDLTANFKMGETDATNLKLTFKGLFAVLDICGQAFSAVFRAVASVIGVTGGLSSGVLSVTASFGGWLVGLDNLIRRTDIFNKVLQNFGDFVKLFVISVESVFGAVGDSVGAFLNTIGTNFSINGFIILHEFLQRLSDRMSQVTNAAGNMSSGVGIAAQDIGTAIGNLGIALANSKFVKVLSALWTFTKTVGEGIVKVLGQMTDALINKLGNADFSSILDLISGVSLGGLALAIAKFLSNVSKPIGELKGMLDGVTKILDGVRGSLEAYQTKLKADTLLKISIAIALLAASIVAISLIDSGKLASSLVAISTLFAELLISMAIFNKISKDSSASAKSCLVMIAMALAVDILATAMKKLGDMDWNGIAKGVVGIAAISTTLVLSAKILSKGSEQMIKGAGGLVIFALAIKVLASACKDLSTLSWSGLAKGLVGVGVLLNQILVFLKLASFNNKTLVTAIGILVLASAMKVLASACKDFGSMSWGDLAKGFVSIAALLAEITLFTKISGGTKGIISTGLALGVMAVSIKILASALVTFGSMSWESIAKGLVAMGAALDQVILAAKLMPKDLVLTGIGLIAVGIALNILAVALKTMGSMSWEEIAKGLVAMGGALAELSLGLYLMSGSMLGSAALLVAAAALAILAPTLKLLGTMSWESIAKGLATLAGVFVVLGLAGLVLTPLVPTILALSAAFVLIGLGVVGFGAGLVLMGIGLTTVATAFGLLAAVTTAGATAITASLTIIITGIAGLIPVILKRFGEGLIELCNVLINGAPAITSAVVVIITSVVSAIVTAIPAIVDGVFKLLSSVLTALVTYTPTILQQVFTILLEALKVISDNISLVVQAGIDVVIGFVNGVASKLPDIIQAAFNLIICFVNGLALAINNNTPALVKAMQNLMDALVHAGLLVLSGAVGSFSNAGSTVISYLAQGLRNKVGEVTNGIASIMSNCISGITNWASNFRNAGSNVIDGFVQGLRDKINYAASWASNLANSVLNSAKSVLGIHSPSTAFASLGKYSVLGYANALKDYASKVTDSAKNLGKSAISAMSSAISGISDAINDGMDSSPIIRPVLDLSEIQNGSKQLYGIMDSLGNYAISGSLDTVNSTAKTMKTNQTADESVNSTGILKDAIDSLKTFASTVGTGASNVFHITSTDPKAAALEVADILQRQVERRDAVWDA